MVAPGRARGTQLGKFCPECGVNFVLSGYAAFFDHGDALKLVALRPAPVADTVGAVANEVNHLEEFRGWAVEVCPNETNRVTSFPGVSFNTRSIEDEQTFVIKLAHAKVVAFGVPIVPEILVDLVILIAVKKANGEPALPAIGHFALSINANVGAFPDTCVLWKKS